MQDAHVEAIASHCASSWGLAGRDCGFHDVPVEDLPTGFAFLEFPPTQAEGKWICATGGMSHYADVTRLELHLFSPVASRGMAEILAATAHFHRTGAHLDHGHTVNFGQSWLGESLCDHGLISLPYLDGPKLEWLDLASHQVRCLWLIPITVSERAVKSAHGLDALERQFEDVGFNYIDPMRAAVA